MFYQSGMSRLVSSGGGMSVMQATNIINKVSE